MLSFHEPFQLTTATSYHDDVSSQRLIVAKTELHRTFCLTNLGSNAFCQGLLETLKSFVTDNAATGSCVQNGMCTEVFHTAIYRFGCARPCKRSALGLKMGTAGRLIVRAFPGRRLLTGQGHMRAWNTIELLPSQVQFRGPTLMIDDKDADWLRRTEVHTHLRKSLRRHQSRLGKCPEASHRSQWAVAEDDGAAGLSELEACGHSAFQCPKAPQRRQWLLEIHCKSASRSFDRFPKLLPRPLEDFPLPFTDQKPRLLRFSTSLDLASIYEVRASYISGSGVSSRNFSNSPSNVDTVKASTSS